MVPYVFVREDLLCSIECACVEYICINLSCMKLNVYREMHGVMYQVYVLAVHVITLRIVRDRKENQILSLGAC